MMNGTALISKEPPLTEVTKTVGLISDTHVPKKAHYLPKKVLEIFEKTDYIIHAGDLVELEVLDELEQIAPVLAVQGNMDDLKIKNTFPSLNSLKIFDWKIGVMHDPDIEFGFNRMRELIMANDFNVFVYGHTHVPSINWESKILYINPGSPTVPASITGKLSVGLLKISKKTIDPQIIEL